MDLTVRAIHDIVHPTAVFSKVRDNGRRPALHQDKGNHHHNQYYHQPRVVVADGFDHLLQPVVPYVDDEPGWSGPDPDPSPSASPPSPSRTRRRPGSGSSLPRSDGVAARAGANSERSPDPNQDLDPDATEDVAFDDYDDPGEFEDDDEAGEADDWGSGNAAEVSWMQSRLNPKNRIDSLDPPRDPMWRIDGCTGLGTQFYMIPLFLNPAPPMRVDVFIPEHADQAPHVRDLLGLASAFHTKDAVRVSRLGVSNYIIRALHFWSKSFADFPVMYTNLPFGSRIILENLPLDLADVRIQVAHTYNLERQMLSLPALASLWAVPDPAHSPFFPERVDLFRLEVIEQVHDSTSIVRFRGETLVFKAITSHTKYIYHELHNLLCIQPHPNIIARPRHLVTKKCRFGSKTAILGFTLEYHAPGTLRDIIPVRRLNAHLSPTDQFRWARQITSALLHLHDTGGPFYPDLRLDNIVLTTADDAVMVDFEQRGVWCEFGPPEINALEYVRLLATDDDEDGLSSASPPAVPGSGLAKQSQGGTTAADDDEEEGITLFSQEYHAGLLRRLLPDYEALLEREDYTQAGIKWGGYNIAWLSLRPREREAAEVYMLGRVLYCIFEGVAAPNRAAFWQSYRWESDVEFPEHLRAPGRIAALIDRCTRGRRPSLTSRLSRVGDRMTLVGEDGAEAEGAESEFAAIQDTATAFWKGEVVHAVRFLEDRLAKMQAGTWNENQFDRPAIKEVLAELDDICRDMGAT